MAASVIAAVLSTAVAASTGTLILGSALAHFLVTTAIGAVLGALAPKPSSGAPQGYSANAAGTDLEQQILYGETKVGGVIVLNATETSTQLHRVIVFTAHEIEEFVDLYVGDGRVTNISPEGWVLEVTYPDGETSSRYSTNLKLQTFRGTENQTASQALQDAFPQGGAIHWTEDHRLRGLSYVHMDLRWDVSVFPNGIPDITARIKGKKVYDPRTDETVWSDNPALCIADYMKADYGLAEEDARINWDDVITAANVCDTLSTVDNQKKFTMNGATLTSVTPHDFFNAALQSMGGLMWYSSGKWRMKAASWTAPVADFDLDNLRSPVDINTRQSRRDNFNAVQGTFRGPDTLYQITDFPQVTVREATTTLVSATELVSGEYYEIETVGDTDWNGVAGTTGINYTVGDVVRATEGSFLGTGFAYETEDTFLGIDNGQRSIVTSELQFTDNVQGCKRLSRIMLERNRQQVTVSALFDITALQVTVGDNVTLTLDRFGWNQKAFEVQTWNLEVAEGDDGFDLNIRMTLREISESVFDEKDDGNIYERDNTTLSPFYEVSPPANGSYASVADLDSDGTKVSDVTFSWQHPEPESVSEYEVNWRKVGTAVWTGNAVARSTSFTLDNVRSNVVWEWRVRAVNSLEIKSPWYVGPSATVAGDTTVPEAPTNLTTYPGYRSAAVGWDNVTLNTDGSSCTDLQQYAIYRNNIFVAYTRGTRFVDNDLGTATSYNFKVKAVDASGNESSDSVTVSVTTLADPEDGTNGTNGTDGTDGEDALTLVVSADRSIMTYDDTGALDPSSQTITFTANRQNVTGTVQWTTSPNVKSGTGDTFTLTGADFGTSYSTATQSILVTATVGGLADSTTVYKLKEGSGGLTVVQSNEAHTVPADSSGVVSTFAGSSNLYSVFQGARQLTPDAGDNTPELGKFTISSVSYVGATGPTGETNSGDNLSLGNLTGMSSDGATRTVTIRAATWPNGDLVEIDVVQSFSKSRQGPNGVAGANGNRGAGRWDIQIPAGNSLPVTSNGARINWNNFGRTNGNNAPVRPVLGDQAWFRFGDSQSVFICDGVTSDTQHTWNRQEEVIDGDLLITGSLNVMDAAIGGDIKSNNWDSSGGTDGWRIRQDGTAVFNGPVFSRNLVLASGQFQVASLAPEYLFVNTGIRIGANDVWAVSNRTLLVTARMVPASANGVPLNRALWRVKGEVYNSFAWFGNSNWNSTTKPGMDTWSYDPATLVDPPWGSGTDQRVMMDLSVLTRDISLNGPYNIYWKVYEVT